MSRPLVLVGFMGAGKTTAARAIAEALGVEAVDADEVLEARLGMPIARFFEERGEDAFRAEEEAVVLEMLARDGPGALALGGGSVTSAAVRDALADHRVLWLDVDVESAWAGPRARTARWRETATASPRCTPSGSRCTRRSPTA